MNRKRRLALLGGAVLMAALAVAAALLLRQNDQEPAERKGSQEIVGAESSADSEKEHAATAPDATDSEALEEEAPSEPNARFEWILSQLYFYNGDEANPKIRELMEYELRQLIEKGADLEEIGSSITEDLDYYRRVSAEKIDAHYQSMLDEKQGIVETDGWKYDPNLTEKQNRIEKYLFEHTGLPYVPEGEKTPRAVIEILVEGMDDLTAAKYLINEPYVFPEAEGEFWLEDETEYAAEYAERVLARDPSSRDALLVKMFSGVNTIETARLLIEHHPTDDDAVYYSSHKLHKEYPEEAIAAVVRILPEDGPHSNSGFHMQLGNAYERLDMLYEAAEQFQIAFAAGKWAGDYRFSILERGERSLPSIWEERAAAAAEAAAQPPQPAEASAHTPQRPPDAPTPPETPRGVEPPPIPPDAEMDMAAAYTDFAKAYQSAFEMEYALSEATPEVYMNALLGMARAFARAGDAKHAQDAYNAARKRYSPEEIQQVFRRFDEQDRLRREASNEQNEEDDDDEP